MSRSTREGTRALQSLAEEVDNERKAKGRTPFDDIPESSRGAHPSTREGPGGAGDSLDGTPEQSEPPIPGAFGSASMVRLLRKSE